MTLVFRHYKMETIEFHMEANYSIVTYGVYKNGEIHGKDKVNVQLKRKKKINDYWNTKPSTQLQLDFSPADAF